MDFRQLFFEFYPSDAFTFGIGEQTIVWGQLDIFSPVDFLLPLDFNPTGFSLIKADNRMPQFTYRLSYYPDSNVEITGYYFPNFRESPLFKGIDFSDDYNMLNDKKYYTQKIVPSGSSGASSALRVVWYNKYFTSGITYYDGFNNVSSNLERQIYWL